MTSNTSMVVHPKHYNNHASGVECIEINRYLSSNLGAALKYVWRFGDKGTPLQDLEKSLFYLRDEINQMDIYAGFNLAYPPPRWEMKADIARNINKLYIAMRANPNNPFLTLAVYIIEVEFPLDKVWNELDCRMTIRKAIELLEKIIQEKWYELPIKSPES